MVTKSHLVADVAPHEPDARVRTYCGILVDVDLTVRHPAAVDCLSCARALRRNLEEVIRIMEKRKAKSG